MDKIVQYEPKRNNRFIVEFPEIFGIEKNSITKVNKPKFTDNKWEDIRVDFVDLIGPSTSQSLYKIIDFINKNDDDNKKLFGFIIASLDPTGMVVETWRIDVEKVLTINFGELDYSDTETQKPYLIVRPLNCVLEY